MTTNRHDMAAALRAEQLLRPGYRRKLLGLLLLANTLSFADRAIMAIAVEPMRRELLFSDAQLGILQGFAFALIFVVMGIPVGRLAERKNRLWILAVAIIVFSVATCLCGSARSFHEMFILRMIVGVGEGAFMAPATSLVADHFPRERRASALAVVLCGTPLGFFVGSLLGGQIAEAWGWRSMFFAMSAPGPLVAASLLLFLREPPRGLADEGGPVSTPTPPPLTAVLATLFRQSAFRHLLAGAILCTCGANAVGQFQNSFYVRVHGLPVSSAAAITGMISFLSLAPGMLIGGNLVDRLQRRDLRWYLWLPAAGTFAGAFLFAAGFLAPEVWLGVTLVILGGIFIFLHYAPCYAVVQLIAGVHQRASAVAIYGVFLGMMGSGLGPTLAGYSSGAIAAANFTQGNFQTDCPGGRGLELASNIDRACQVAAASGMRGAMLIAAGLIAWSSLHFFLGSRAIRRALAASHS